jgi:glycosyltransferase involved in cell wall biosynthesis
LSETSGNSTDDPTSGSGRQRRPAPAGDAAPLKLLVFAHTPPPHHGQSYMVQLMIAGFGGDARRHGAVTANRHGIECYHVNARLSRSLDDVGSFRPWKLFSVLRYCFEAVWCRFRHGVTTLYYIPAPGKISALLRDWLVLTLCRPFFPRLVLHWHAAGLKEWLDASAGPVTRALTRLLLGNAALSVTLSEYNLRDAAAFKPRRTCVVANGITDPCPDFDAALGPAREERRRRIAAALQAAAAPDAPAETIHALYMAHCTEDKGLFDAVEAVRLANRRLRNEGRAARIVLEVAGSFVDEAERRRFEALLAEPELRDCVTALGFISGAAKGDALRRADVFCFPTYFANENQPVNLIEAMAYGLPVVTTRWRSVPECLPEAWPFILPPRGPGELAGALPQAAACGTAPQLRREFLNRFRLDAHLDALAAAMRSAS